MKWKALVFDFDGTLISSDNGSLLEGVEGLLKDLSRAGIELYLWTRASGERTKKLLEQYHLSSYFLDLAYDGSDPPKPYPEALERLVGHFAKTSVAMIGDSLSDITAAKKFGIEGIGANWYHHLPAHHQLLKNFGAHVVFDSIDELKAYLLEKRT